MQDIEKRTVRGGGACPQAKESRGQGRPHTLTHASLPLSPFQGAVPAAISRSPTCPRFPRRLTSRPYASSLCSRLLGLGIFSFWNQTQLSSFHRPTPLLFTSLPAAPFCREAALVVVPRLRPRLLFQLGEQVGQTLGPASLVYLASSLSALSPCPLRHFHLLVALPFSFFLRLSSTQIPIHTFSLPLLPSLSSLISLFSLYLLLSFFVLCPHPHHALALSIPAAGRVGPRTGSSLRQPSWRLQVRHHDDLHHPLCLLCDFDHHGWNKVRRWHRLPAWHNARCPADTREAARTT